MLDETQAEDNIEVADLPNFRFENVAMQFDVDAPAVAPSAAEDVSR